MAPIFTLPQSLAAAGWGTPLGCGAQPADYMFHTCARDSCATRKQVAPRPSMCSRILSRCDGLESKQAIKLMQAGNAVALAPQQRRLVVAGLVLHSQGLDAMRARRFSEAFTLLQHSERAFDAADDAILAAVDNVGLMMLDLVWCAYMLQVTPPAEADPLNPQSCVPVTQALSARCNKAARYALAGGARACVQDDAQLAVSAKRLRRARAELERAYGHGQARLHRLQGGVDAAATFLRLECLEGLLARYTGDAAACRRAVAAAQARCRALAVSDTALASLVAMGFESRSAVRALRFCAGDVAKATDVCMEQQAAAQRRKEDEAGARAARKLQKELGRTADGQWIDAQAMQQLEGLGFPVLVVAEALRCVCLVQVCAHLQNLQLGVHEVSGSDAALGTNCVLLSVHRRADRRTTQSRRRWRCSRTSKGGKAWRRQLWPRRQSASAPQSVRGSTARLLPQQARRSRVTLRPFRAHHKARLGVLAVAQR